MYLLTGVVLNDRIDSRYYVLRLLKLLRLACITTPQLSPVTRHLAHLKSILPFKVPLFQPMIIIQYMSSYVNR